jgi:hypothetical protein
MPSILKQHGFGKGVRTVKFYGTSDANPDLVFRIPKALAKADVYLSSRPKDAQMRLLKGIVQRDAGKPNDALITFA